MGEQPEKDGLSVWVRRASEITSELTPHVVEQGEPWIKWERYTDNPSQPSPVE